MGWTDWLESIDKPAETLASASQRFEAPPPAAVSQQASPTAALAGATTPLGTVASTSADSAALAQVVPPAARPTEVKQDTSPDVFTVSQLNKKIRGLLEGRFETVWLKAEISNFKAHPSGHFYFSLKDSSAQISAVMFRGFNSTLKFRPEDGLEVLVRGKITVYEPRGNYQIVCETMDPVGTGALLQAFEQLKKKLELEGLFDSKRKRPIPQLPKHIGLVTSSSGAALRDMLNVLGRRYRMGQITLIPCAVQGEKAPREIVQAIELANQVQDLEVLIVGRGGGSIEDLWAFNDENVARAIAASRIPIISAVGHEVDFTIADFVADLRAPTPSAAAELVAKSAVDLELQVSKLKRSLHFAFGSKLTRLKERLNGLQRMLVDPRRRLEDANLRLDDLIDRLERAIIESIERTEVHLELLSERLVRRTEKQLERPKAQLLKAATLLDGLSPLRVLDRGYAMVQSQGKVVSSAGQVQVGDSLVVRLAQGELQARVESIRDSGRSGK